MVCASAVVNSTDGLSSYVSLVTYDNQMISKHSTRRNPLIQENAGVSLWLDRFIISYCTALLFQGKLKKLNFLTNKFHV